ncbi:SDR family NAD(P)-dependent oxidoreductase [Leptospira bandrabouensis]|uniref:SDR family oxidoreductase n=1 Tax=Leptospira bandrabouensis TaxID=2484903 RepID=A0A6H3NSE6_9LEPT|nr:SDR family oxidoreductase [Leptospira bandrabouensis]MCG6150774.1 SDR family oxidoreductase [Leptospira bandrabouensis]TGN05404.1 SDR family oxidoreductase [Leptospira bandrabouensis]TGN15737.1 SDR family oxidoreductase [Leptospira bandrabouensis]
MKYALITGASTGLGKDFALTLAKKGYTPVLVARNAERLKALATEIKTKYGIQSVVITQDLGKPNAAEVLYKAVKKLKLSIHCLVNNAGFGLNGEFFKNSFEKESELIQLNVTTLAQLCHLFLQDMIKAKDGYILNVASTAAFQPGPLMSNYYASKAYVLSLSEGLAEEVRDYGVTVTCVCPGPTQTEFFERANMTKINLVKSSFLIMNSQDVVDIGLDALFGKKVVKITGFFNFLLAQSVRFSPRFVVRLIAKYLHKAG